MFAIGASFHSVLLVLMLLLMITMWLCAAIVQAASMKWCCGVFLVRIKQVVCTRLKPMQLSCFACFVFLTVVMQVWLLGYKLRFEKNFLSCMCVVLFVISTVSEHLGNNQRCISGLAVTVLSKCRNASAL